VVKKYLEISRGGSFRVLTVIIPENQLSKCEKFYDPVLMTEPIQYYAI